MALRFDFEAPTRSFYFLFLTPNMLVNKHSDLISLGFFIVVGVLRKLGLTSVISSGVDTVAASRISFRFCWSSHLPEC